MSKCEFLYRNPVEVSNGCKDDVALKCSPLIIFITNNYIYNKPYCQYLRTIERYIDIKTIK